MKAPDKRHSTEKELAGKEHRVGGTIVLLAAAGMLTVISRMVQKEETKDVDQTLHETLQAHRSRPMDLAAKPVTLLSLPILVVTATAGLVFWLKQQDRTEAALAIGFAPVAAATLGQTFTMFFPQRNPPDNQNDATGAAAEASFPSGHTAGVTAEALAIGYVLSREKLISPSVLALVLGWPLIVGGMRLYRDRHWASDILAGWVAGAGVAAASAVLYDILVSREQPPA
jgi:Membrane-associated phospholipid phosphatase